MDGVGVLRRSEREPSWCSKVALLVSLPSKPRLKSLLQRHPSSNGFPRAGPIAERVIPVFVVLPPRTLLLDVAGPAGGARRAEMGEDRARVALRLRGGTGSVRKFDRLHLGPDVALSRAPAAGSL